MAAITSLRPKPPPTQRWVNNDGTPTEQFSTFIQAADALLRMLNGTGGIVLVDAVNDAAAAAAGVELGALYRNGSAVMIRVV